MVFEPPCTERYARWCDRTTAQIMSTLLLDYTVGNPHIPADAYNAKKSRYTSLKMYR